MRATQHADREFGGSYDDGTAPSAAQRSGTARWGSAAAWAGAGFVVGATVWHFVGFWSFVTLAVLGGPEWEQSTRSARPVATIACATLALDRKTGLTRLLDGCDDLALATQQGHPAPRSDVARLAASN